MASSRPYDLSHVATVPKPTRPVSSSRNVVIKPPAPHAAADLYTPLGSSREPTPSPAAAAGKESSVAAAVAVAVAVMNDGSMSDPESSSGSQKKKKRKSKSGSGSVLVSGAGLPRRALTPQVPVMHDEYHTHHVVIADIHDLFTTNYLEEGGVVASAAAHVRHDEPPPRSGNPIERDSQFRFEAGSGPGVGGRRPRCWSDEEVRAKNA